MGIRSRGNWWRLALPLPSAAKRLWKFLAWTRRGEEISDLRAKCLREFFQYRNGWVLNAAFEATDIRTVDLRIDRQILLRKSLLYTELSEVMSHDLLRLHGGRRTS